jgi:Fe-S cluster biogenesis protein NfuA
MSNDIEARVREVLHNLNWLLDAHDSSAELIKVEGNTVFLLCKGQCTSCETECIQVAFSERMPEVELVMQELNN